MASGMDSHGPTTRKHQYFYFAFLPTPGKKIFTISKIRATKNGRSGIAERVLLSAAG